LFCDLYCQRYSDFCFPHPKILVSIERSWVWLRPMTSFSQLLPRYKKSTRTFLLCHVVYLNNMKRNLEHLSCTRTPLGLWPTMALHWRQSVDRSALSTQINSRKCYFDDHGLIPATSDHKTPISAVKPYNLQTVTTCLQLQGHAPRCFYLQFAQVRERRMFGHVVTYHRLSVTVSCFG